MNYRLFAMVVVWVTMALPATAHFRNGLNISVVSSTKEPPPVQKATIHHELTRYYGTEYMGNGMTEDGWLLTFSFPRHPVRETNNTLRITIWREKDIFNPRNKGNEFLDWSALESLPFQVGPGKDDIGGVNNDAPNLQYEKIYKWKGWSPYSIKLPNALFMNFLLPDNPKHVENLPVKYYIVYEVDAGGIHFTSKKSITPSVTYVMYVPENHAHITDLGNNDLSSLMDDEETPEKPEKPERPKKPEKPKPLTPCELWPPFCEYPPYMPPRALQDSITPTPEKTVTPQHQHIWCGSSETVKVYQEPHMVLLKDNQKVSVVLSVAGEGLWGRKVKNGYYISQSPLTYRQLAAIYYDKTKNMQVVHPDDPVLNLNIFQAQDIADKLNDISKRVDAHLEFVLPSRQELVDAGVCAMDDFSKDSIGMNATLTPKGELLFTILYTDNSAHAVNRPYTVVVARYFLRCRECGAKNYDHSFTNTFRFRTKEDAEWFKGIVDHTYKKKP